MTGYRAGMTVLPVALALALSVAVDVNEAGGSDAAPAPASPPTTTDPLAAAQEAYEGLDFERARAELILLLGGEDLTDPQRAEAHLLAGQVAVILDRDTEAHGHFTWVLSRNPDVTLPATAPAKVQVAFDLVRSELKAARPGVDEPAAVVATPMPTVRPDRFTAGATVAAVGAGAVCVTSAAAFSLACLSPAAPAVAVVTAPLAVSGAAAIGTRAGNVESSDAFWPGVAAAVVGTAIVGVYAGVAVPLMLADEDAYAGLLAGAVPVGLVAGAASGLTFGLMLGDDAGTPSP